MTVRRRDCISLLGATVATWPFVAGAQQAAVPVVGFLSSRTPDADGQRMTAFRKGLGEGGYIEGRNIAIEFRWAEDHYDRLPALADDLVQRRVAVIVAAGSVNSALAAKAASATIPIVFGNASDPVQIGLVTSLARPGGNATGVTTLGRELLAKRFEVLRELVPNLTRIGLLVNPNNPNTEPSVRELQAMAQLGGWSLRVVAADAESDIEKAFAALTQMQAGAFLHAVDALFNSSAMQMVALASRYGIPGIYTELDAVRGGGLIGYGSSPVEQYRLIGGYTARILKGEKPADLPVQQSTKIELVVNLKTAKALGLTVPPSLLTRADEVIE